MKDFFQILSILSGFVGVFAYSRAYYRNGATRADKTTIESYKQELEILNVRLDRVEKENKDLLAKINMMIERNKVLEEILALRDPNFLDNFSKLSKAVCDMQYDYQVHYNDDVANFDKIEEQLAKINERLRITNG